MLSHEIPSCPFSFRGRCAVERSGVDPYGIDAMLPKMSHLNVLIEGLVCRVANIVKQEMLSVGGDAAVARGSLDVQLNGQMPS